MTRTLRQLLQPRPMVCALCGTGLRPTLQKKYDSFWSVLLIFAGAVLAFFLVGIAMMTAGLWMLQKEETVWICPACSGTEQQSGV